MPQTTQPAPATAPKPKPPEPPSEFQEGRIATMDAAGLIRILGDGSSTEFQKAKACQRIGELGPKEAVPTLAALLADEHLSVYARTGLETIADASADETLRSSLNKLSGIRLIGVINSIGKRRDAAASPALARMIHGRDTDVACAAAAALGSIGGASSARELRGALAKTTGQVRTAVANASLVCAERLLAEGKRDQALEFYTALSATDLPKPVRLAAMNSIIREETSPGRPR